MVRVWVSRVRGRIITKLLVTVMVWFKVNIRLLRSALSIGIEVWVRIRVVVMI